MAQNNRQAKLQLPVSGTFNGSVAGTAKAGSTIPVLGSPGCSPSSIVANISMGVFTATLTMTPSWQVSQDGSTWVDLKVQNNAAVVATAAGTGSLVTTTIALVLPIDVPFPYVRAIVTNAVATGVASDTYSISYNWKKPDFA